MVTQEEQFEQNWSDDWDITVTWDDSSIWDSWEIISFDQLWLREWVLKWLAKAGYTKPTPIQAQVIDRFVHGNHIVWQSQTGTGKTAAFVVPLINAIDPRSRKVQAIVMAPTRELVVQTEEEFFKLAWWSPGFRSVAMYGGGSKFRQLSQLEKWAQVIVATPGRLIDYIHSGKVDPTQVKYFVLDEADRMLDMWFKDDIEEIMSLCANVEQIMSFSATITPELNQILTRYTGSEYDFIKTTSEIVVDKIDHSFIHVSTIDKVDLLHKYINEHKDQKIIIFTQTKMSTDDVATQLHKMWHKVAAIHGDIDQRHRMRTIKDLKSDYLKILVATDVAARGLNLNDVQLVVNYEVPQDPEAYVHRIGRTARAGASGKAITFADNRELESLKLIERRNKLFIKQIDAEGTILEQRIIDRLRGAAPSRRRGNSRFGGSRTWRFDEPRSGSFGGWDRNARGSYGSSQQSRPSYGDRRSSGWDRQWFGSSDRGPRGSFGGWDRSRSGWDRFGGASRGWDRGNWSRFAGWQWWQRWWSRWWDRGYRYNDSQEAGARDGVYEAKRDNQMFVPRNKYY